MIDCYHSSRVQSDGSAILSEDEIEDSLIQKSKSTTTTPPQITKPTGLDSPSAPPTPYVLDKDGLSIKSENRETRHLRQRVEALECDDDGQALVTSATTESIVQDTEIADGQGENKESKDLELVDVVTEANGSEEKDMEVAEVAAEVAVTAELLIKQDEVANDIEFVDASKPVEEKVELVGIAQPQVSEHESPQETKPIASKVSNLFIENLRELNKFLVLFSIFFFNIAVLLGTYF